MSSAVSLAMFAPAHAQDAAPAAPVATPGNNGLYGGVFAGLGFTQPDYSEVGTDSRPLGYVVDLHPPRLALEAPADHAANAGNLAHVMGGGFIHRQGTRRIR